MATDLLNAPELDAALREAREAVEADAWAALRGWIFGKGDPLSAARVAVGGALAAVVVIAVLWVGPGLSPQSRPNAGLVTAASVLTEHTARAQTRTLTLADDSLVALSADTVVEITMSDTARTIRLVQGEAYFDVASDLDRPFTVATGDMMFTALGTAFNVDRRHRSAELSVFEGQVSDGVLILEAGEGVLAGPDGSTAFRFDPSDGPDWRSGWMEARALTLAEAAAQLQRYSTDRLIIAPSAADRRVTGRFRLDAPETALRRIADVHGLVVERSESAILVRTADG